VKNKLDEIRRKCEKPRFTNESLDQGWGDSSPPALVSFAA
jgi:hypothetical protein